MVAGIRQRIVVRVGQWIVRDRDIRVVHGVVDREIPLAIEDVGRDLVLRGILEVAGEDLEIDLGVKVVRRRILLV